MEWREILLILAPIATITAAVITGITVLKLQAKKHQDDIDLKALENSLDKKFEEFKSALVRENAYLTEAGKNAATKEDVEEITRKVETIRHEVATPSEVLKWQLSKKANLHKLQAEKEFEVYSRIWEKAIELRFASGRLRPTFDKVTPDKPQSEVWFERYKKAGDSYDALLMEIEKQRPFYSEDLYRDLKSLLRLNVEEIVGFETSVFYGEQKIALDDYKIARENMAKIESEMERVCDLMRRRISES